MKDKVTRIFGNPNENTYYVCLCLANFMGSKTVALSTKNQMTWKEANQYMINWANAENCHTENNYPKWN